VYNRFAFFISQLIYQGAIMTFKTLLTVIFSLLTSSSVLAQGQQGQGNQGRPPARAVPELDGNMAFLALGLAFAVGALVREKRRNT
jgi:hypothetical protein